jgi:hypothetical protein
VVVLIVSTIALLIALLVGVPTYFVIHDLRAGYRDPGLE